MLLSVDDVENRTTAFIDLFCMLYFFRCVNSVGSIDSIPKIPRLNLPNHKFFYAYQTSNLPKSKSFKSLQPKLKFKHPEFSKNTEQTLNIDLAQHYMCDVSRLLTYYYIPLRAQYFNSIGLHITSLALFTQSIVLFGKRNMYMHTIFLIILNFQDSHIF